MEAATSAVARQRMRLADAEIDTGDLHVVESDRDGPTGLGPFAERRPDDLGKAPRGRQRGALESVAHRSHQDLTGEPEFSADDDQCGVEQVAQAGGGDPDMATGIGDHATRTAVTGLSRLQKITESLHAFTGRK